MIVIGMPRFGSVDSQWLQAFDALQKPMKPDGSPDWRPLVIGRTVVSQARNMIVQIVLQGSEAIDPRDHPNGVPEEYSQASHILFLDDDTMMPPDGLMRLLSHDLPIVGGLVCLRGGRFLPSVYRRVPGTEAQHVFVTRFKRGLQEVDAIGGACLLVKREVFEKMSPPWFDYQCGATPGETISEDFYFCLKARALGYPIVLDFEVQCGHLALRPVTFQDFLAANAGGVGPTITGPGAHDVAARLSTDDLAALANEVRPWPREDTQATPP